MELQIFDIISLVISHDSKFYVEFMIQYSSTIIQISDNVN